MKVLFPLFIAIIVVGINRPAGASQGNSEPADTAHRPSFFCRHFDVTKGLYLQAPSPFLSIGGRIGIGMKKEILEAGLEGALIDFPMSEKAVGVLLGPYLQVAPVPIAWGKRIYLHVRGYGSRATGKPTFNAWAWGFGLGYRQPLGRCIKARYLFFEIGVQKAYLVDYDEYLYTLDLVKVGLAW